MLLLTYQSFQTKRGNKDFLLYLHSKNFYIIVLERPYINDVTSEEEIGDKGREGRIGKLGVTAFMDAPF